jgi:quinol monooxygenase YgiN
VHAVILNAQLQSTISDESVVEIIHRMLTETRGFDGCLGVETLVDTKDPSKIMIIERWESKEANNAYLAWRQGEGAARAQQFGALLTGAPSMSKATPAPEL